MRREPGDVMVRCVDCGDVFAWTDKEQRFYAERHFSPPKRCGRCRQVRQQQRAKADTADVTERDGYLGRSPRGRRDA
jgi:hypothetical protein